MIRPPPSAFTKLDMLGLKNWAGADIPAGAEVLMSAALWRSATSTIKSCPPLIDMLNKSATESFPMVATVKGHWSAE
eukprot:991932-Pyramimonas_sp.AAC.1